MYDGLNAWDRRLIARHLRFYEALDLGRRAPTTPLQAHFVAVLRHGARPCTQHEIAYARYRRDPPARERITRTAVRCGEPAARVVDWLDVSLIEPASADAPGLVERARQAYFVGLARAKRASVDAAILIQAALSDGALSSDLSRLAAESRGTLSNVYTRAMDGAFAEGLKSGADHIPPGLHRIFEGHSVIDAWSAVRAALPNDSPAEELWGFVMAYASDLATQAGMPLTTLSRASFDQLAGWLGTFGIPTSTVADLVTFNLTEVAAGALPIIGLMFGWSERDTATFARIAGASAASGVVAANPLALVVALVFMAQAFDASTRPSGRLRGLAEGAAASTIVLAASAAIAGPALVGVLSGVALALGIRRAAKRGLFVTVSEARLAAADLLRTTTTAARALAARYRHDWSQRPAPALA